MTLWPMLGLVECMRGNYLIICVIVGRCVKSASQLGKVLRHLEGPTGSLVDVLSFN